MEEALRAKAFAEKQFLEKDFVGAKNYALKAQVLCLNWRVYRKCWSHSECTLLPRDSIRRWQYYSTLIRIEPLELMGHLDLSPMHGRFYLIVLKEALMIKGEVCSLEYATGAGVYDNCSRSDTFWTVCTSCHVQYEYLRKYVNKRLSCKNCRGVFIAVETGLAPMSGSFPYSTCSYVPENGYGSHGCGVTYIPKTTGYPAAPNGPTGHHHTGYRTEYVSNNISFQGNSSVNSVGVLDPNGLSTSSFVLYQANGDANKTKINGEHNNRVKATTVHMASNGYNTGHNDLSRPKRGRPSKKRKMDFGSLFTNESPPNVAAEAKIADVKGPSKPAPRLSSPSETSTRRCSAAPVFDARQLLITKARSVIRTKLEEMRLAGSSSGRG
ncbi:hypothetical protein DH2020_022706 [Rehmannia glutinosa]|uniref:Zinc beta-ribbon domain-containing protein n=1 Tax=Rehmannia glutinosa TaxID=99300 RepID=A0ABR0W3X5_REHGL